MKRKKKVGVLLSGMVLAGITLTGCSASGSSQSAATTASAQAQSSKNVTIGYVSWTEDVALSYLWKNLLEQKGYHVTLKEMQTGPLYLGLSQEGLDLHLDAWLPYTDKNYIEKYGNSFTDLGTWYQGEAKIGIVVPKYVNNINSLTDLKQHGSEFDNRIVGIDPGSGEMEVVAQAQQKYGLNAMNLVSGSETMMLSALQTAVAQHKPIAVTLWSPHWAFAKWPLKYLDDPKGALGKSEHIDIESNKKWADSHPEVVKWLKAFKLNPQQLGQMEIDINDAHDTDKGVKKWMQDNSKLVSSWFK